MTVETGAIRNKLVFKQVSADFMIQNKKSKCQKFNKKPKHFLKNDAHGLISFDLLSPRWPSTSSSSDQLRSGITTGSTEWHRCRNKEMRAILTKTFTFLNRSTRKVISVSLPELHSG